MELLAILFIPLLGTSLGAGCVYFMKGKMNDNLQKALLGFAGGVMVAASVWSLLIPAMDMSKDMDKLSFIPAVTGLLLGVLFLLLLDNIIPHLHVNDDEPEGPKTTLKKSAMLMLAVTLHNIPEGMAVGVLFAGYTAGNTAITFSAALTLAIGIAIQNFPEGAIISMPLRNEGFSKNKSFLYGVLSGVVEPIGAILTILAASLVEPMLPYLLSFAAGAMIYVVVEELIPEASRGEHSNIGVIGFSVGFAIMMVLDVALG
ncbi:ZIP family metal transporter [Miniphocaeibacter halophilus]|uniref:ZIP family metal transporter n=1 Tax=Miniphocaeibacter halophilus TaxID=2931922 RepID=A0AC61MMT3_9FIRM|nr:ZIP family metal transporter [Miniphocaeibacter halophilus]QQK06936.1 ZIP family metal transporter [Miniphocaeibacter halophilus]